MARIVPIAVESRGGRHAMLMPSAHARAVVRMPVPSCACSCRRAVSCSVVRSAVGCRASPQFFSVEIIGVTCR